MEANTRSSAGEPRRLGHHYVTVRNQAGAAVLALGPFLTRQEAASMAPILGAWFRYLGGPPGRVGVAGLAYGARYRVGALNHLWPGRLVLAGERAHALAGSPLAVGPNWGARAASLARWLDGREHVDYRMGVPGPFDQ